MRKYAIVIRKFQRRLNIAISDFPDIGVYGFEEDFENKEEDDDSKLAVYDPWSRERIGEARGDESENEDEDEDKDEDDDSYHRSIRNSSSEQEAALHYKCQEGAVEYRIAEVD